MQVCLHALFLEYAAETGGNKCKAILYTYKQIGMRSLELFWPCLILAKNQGDVLALSLSIISVPHNELTRLGHHENTSKKDIGKVLHLFFVLVFHFFLNLLLFYNIIFHNRRRIQKSLTQLEGKQWLSQFNKATNYWGDSQGIISHNLCCFWNSL